MKVVCVCQARMGSTRLPGKVLLDLAGKPTIAHVVDAAKMTHGVDEIWVATSTLPADDPIVEWCKRENVRFFRGSETDVLSRFIGVAEASNADILIRLTCDCPFLDPEVIGQVIRLREMTDAHYATNTDPPTYPDGLDCEVFTVAALKYAHEQATRASDRDCVTSYIRRNKSMFDCENLVSPLPGMHSERWVLDSPYDLEFCRKVIALLPYPKAMHSHLQVLSVLERNPGLRQINDCYARNERTYDSMADEVRPEPSYVLSQKMLTIAKQAIPLGAQTFSKSHIQFPGYSPLFVTHGEGGIVYDVDGNEYIDLISALCPNILGYCDPDVDYAIRRQLNRGNSFSLATELEVELAELLVDHIPCAEMVRFGKTGTDVTSAAVRLARAYTDRKLILSSGFHGWADWSIGHDQMRGLGANSIGTVPLQHGDLTVARQAIASEQYAAVIVEPETDAMFLLELRKLCDRHGTLLIFDEVITGFRFDMGGAQKLFGVTPDLACFGKAMANGMPLSAIVGRAPIMKKMEPPGNIFYSGTFFGETLSLAAGIATIKKLEKHNALSRIRGFGNELMDHVHIARSNHSLDSVVTFAGHPSLKRVKFNDVDGANANQLRTLFIKEMARNGVLLIASHNLCWAHTFGDYTLRRVGRAYENTFAAMAEAIRIGDIEKRIGSVIEAQPVRAA